MIQGIGASKGYGVGTIVRIEETDLRNGNPLQYSCLENSMDEKSLVGYSPQGHKESDTTERLHFFFVP